MEKPIYMMLRERMGSAWDFLDAAHAETSPCLRVHALVYALRCAYEVQMQLRPEETGRRGVEGETFSEWISQWEREAGSAGGSLRTLLDCHSRYADTFESIVGAADDGIMPAIGEAQSACRKVLARVEAQLRGLRPRYSWRRALLRIGIVGTILVMGVLAVQASVFLAKELSPDGIRVTYYRGIKFDRRVCRRTEFAVVTQYGGRKPALFVPKRNFSARWEGFVNAPADAEYAFASESAGGLRLYIDGEPIIDNWRDQSWGDSERIVKKSLTAGEHRIVVEYFNRSGKAGLRVRWAGGRIPGNTVLGVPFLYKETRPRAQP